MSIRTKAENIYVLLYLICIVVKYLLKIGSIIAHNISNIKFHAWVHVEVDLFHAWLGFEVHLCPYMVAC